MSVTAQEHFDRCVERAMTYMLMGKRQLAVMSFVTDIELHPGTESIASSSATLVLTLGTLHDPERFRQALESLKVQYLDHSTSPHPQERLAEGSLD